MAALPSPTQVAGNNSAIYESYYNFVDPNGFGTVGAMEAARFLKRSGLSDVVLSRVWDLSDPGGRGCLDKSGMFVALKLVALAQAGRDINLTNIMLDMPPPKMGDIPLPKPVKPPPPSNTPLITSVPPTAGVDWTIKPTEREKYDKLFDSLRPLNGLIPGNKVKGVLMDSKLPMETLGKIWDLADQDKDGMLDRHEFVVAMHLVYKALEKHAIPNVLPVELMAPVKRKDSSNTGTPIIPRGIDGVKPDLPPPPTAIEPVVPPSKPPPVPQQPVTTSAPAPAVSPWVVTSDEKAKSDALFIKSDIDRDGFVSGQEIKDVFLQSGVPQAILAHIWALCDIKQSGKLNNEQFALAMWFVARCLQGVDPPIALTPEMVPPSFRTTKPSDVLENNNTPYSNPELDMISKDIEELSREKLALEADITQKEADIKIKNGEIKSLQSELDTLAATLKQLENQKGEAQKRLNDLKLQRSEVDKEMEEVITELIQQQAKVDKLRIQATEQSEAVATQESELSSKKQQLEGLRQEEQRLEEQKTENLKKLEQLSSKLSDTQLTISQAKAIITQLEEQSRQMNDAIITCDAAIECSDPLSVPDTALRLDPEFRDPKYHKVAMVNGEITPLQQNGFDDKDPFSNQNGPSTFSAFHDDPFKSDPFKNNSDAFSMNDSFNAAFSKTDGFSSDPFNSFSTSTTNAKTDPFDAFGDRNRTNTENNVENSKDPFGCDPFAILHAPTRDGSAPPPPRPSSPSPALPPKKCKQPPPRPAPPRPAPPSLKQGQSQSDEFPSTADPFSSPGAGSFANFADFDAKFSDKPSTTSTNTTSKTLDFTDDPFRDYRYEDPFNIAFDDEPSDVAKSSNSIDAFSNSSANTLENKNKKFDPFGIETLENKKSSITDSGSSSGRQSAPLVTSDPFLNSSGRASAPLHRLSELEQVAWATKESKKNEEARKQRLKQEQADLALAIALSKAENKKH